MNERIWSLAKELGELCLEKKYKLVTAESCTAGGLSYVVTSIPGSSEWFDRGFVTYTNLSKQEQLDVPPLTISSFGAVSEETACEMANGALKHSHANVSIAITGIAGPDGGTKEKPIGMVWFGLNSKKHSPLNELEFFNGGRTEIRTQAIEMALGKLMSYLKG